MCFGEQIFSSSCMHCKVVYEQKHMFTFVSQGEYDTYVGSVHQSSKDCTHETFFYKKETMPAYAISC
jgi:hypothetical protein